MDDHDPDTCLSICCGACARCGRPFDATDTHWDGQARHAHSDYCRSCVTRCHDNESADHRCVICS